MNPKLMLIDGNSLINRAFFGLAGRSRLTAPDGTPTGALFAFINMYLRFRDELGPDKVITAFDRKEPTFRHQLYDGYKATRKGMPDDLAVQMPILKKLIGLMGIGQIEVAGFEADDLIGTLAKTAADQGYDVVILTGDKDSFQLVDKRISIWQPVTKTGKTEVLKFDTDSIIERYGIRPEQFVDLKALMGDPSDNIPGVRGIGEKGAMDLIAKYGSLDQIYTEIDSIKVNLADKLRESRDMAYLSQTLSRINCEVPLAVTLQDLKGHTMDRPGLKSALMALDFRSLIGRLGLNDELENQTVQSSPSEILTLIPSDFSEFKTALIEAQNKPLAMAWTIAPDRTFYWQLADHDPQVVGECAPDLFDKIWEDLAFSGISTVCYDYKRSLRQYQIKPLKGAVHDVVVAAYILNQLEGKPDLERLYQRVLNEPWPFDRSANQNVQDPFAASEITPKSNAKVVASRQQDLFALVEQAASISLEDAPVSMREAERDETPVAVIALNRMASAQSIAFGDRGIARLALDIEFPLAGILAQMEIKGFAIDQIVLLDLANSMQTRIDELQNEVFALCGKTFNLQSPKQLGQILYEHLGLSTGKKRTGGNYSTDSEELERLLDQHPAIAPIIEHRLIAKLRSTFVEGLRKATDPRDGRVHTTFNQVLTATGRLSSTDPNLQNIPIRSEQGNKIRTAFIAAPGHILLDADYSQIELRLLAHLAQDPAMLSAFNRQEDIHLNTACHIFNLPPDQITSAQRSIAKTMNFSIVYGISDFGLARDLGVSFKLAHEYIEGYNQQYPHVRQYLDGLVKKAYETGYVETLFGRRRFLPELQSANRNLRQFGERAAMNTPIQGTAADLIKLAMVRTQTLFDEAGLKSRLVLQVHDELIVEALIDEADQAAVLLKIAMEDALKLDVPLIAEVHQGQRWSDCKN